MYLKKKIAERYGEIGTKLYNNTTIKNYLPEIWYYLIKVKATYYRGLSHYYASSAISTSGLERVWDNLEVESLFDDLHDKSKMPLPTENFAPPTLLSSSSASALHYHQTAYFQKQMFEQNQLYEYGVLRSEKRFLLGFYFLFLTI